MLEIKNNLIHKDIIEILKRVSNETTYLKDIINKGNEVVVTCPFHKDGQEKTPACGIITNEASDIPYGTFHCFACKTKGPFSEIINKCYNRSWGDPFGEEWLIDNYADGLVEYQVQLPQIKEVKQETQILDESILNTYSYGKDTPASIYLNTKRHIKQEVIDYFGIGYEKETNSVVFPVYNINNKLAMISKRDINSHRFNFLAGLEKPIYLLNEAIKQNYTTIIVCESQINALTCYSYGYPAIALMGTGSKTQLEQLKRSGIRNFILMFDGDMAGRHGAMRFKNELTKNCMIYDVKVPDGKDVNDLSFDEFYNLINQNLTNV